MDQQWYVTLNVVFFFKVTTYVSAPGDAELMKKMKETIDSQRDVIRSKNLEIEKQKEDVDAVSDIKIVFKMWILIIFYF